MTRDRFLNHCLFCAFILITGFGLAFALPWLANSQGQAAQFEPARHLQPDEPTRFYVAITGTSAGGTTWETAFKNLQDALSAAAADPTLHPVEIWVAKGVYYPDVGGGQTGDDESATFEMSDGVALYGGFNFGDANFSDRDPINIVTVLSGDIDGNDIKDSYGVVITTSNIISDNANHVVSAKNVTGTAVLDGFTITAGQADEAGENDGGGFICEGSDFNHCNPILSNIRFSGNYAENDGGAMYNFGHVEGSSSPALNHVTFSGNSAGGNGGAMCNYRTQDGSASPTLINVTFSGNSAGWYGGAMYNEGNQGGSSNPTLKDVIFSDNTTGYDGGAMYNRGDEGSSSPNLTDVTFSNNSSNNGGALVNDGSDGYSNPTMTSVTFTENTSKYDGGAMFTLCENGRCHPSLTGVFFLENHANRDGGAIYNEGDGGHSDLKLTNVIFSGNSASEAGGAYYNDCDGYGECYPVLTNVLFSGNSAGDDGGAVYNDGGDGGTNIPILTNVTFSGNAASGLGGAVYSYGDGGTCDLHVRNTIIWNNSQGGVTSTISASISNMTATVTLSNSLTQGAGTSGPGWYGGNLVDGGGNIDTDPMFVTPVNPGSAPTTAGNLRLKTTSPAIDAGKNIYVPVEVTTDLDGEARIKDGTGDGTAAVDMGAYEAKGYFSLYTVKDGSGIGTVSSTPPVIDCGDTCTAYLFEDTSLTLQAAPGERSEFNGWSGTCSGTGDCALTIEADTYVTATFETALKVDLPVIFR